MSGHQSIAAGHVPGEPGVAAVPGQEVPVSGHVALVQQRLPLVEDGL